MGAALVGAFATILAALIGLMVPRIAAGNLRNQLAKDVDILTELKDDSPEYRQLAWHNMNQCICWW